MAEENVTYTIEHIDRAFGEREGVPWGRAQRVEGLTERKAIKLYNDIDDWYHPEGRYGGYSGHVRIVGSDDWAYTVEPPEPGERATLSPLYHLDDL